MAITTLNGVIGGLQPVQVIVKPIPPALVAFMPQSLWGLAGQPGAGGFNTGIAGATYTSPVTGGIPHFDPPGGTNSYLARFQNSWSINSGTVMLCDRLWDGRPAINTTGAQTVNSVAWPARDVAGTTNGDGVLIGIEIASTVSSTAAALTNYTYTNQSGTGSRTGNFLDAPTAATTAAGRFFRLSLQAGDTGVQSIQSINFSTAWTSGTMNMVAYRVLAVMDNGGIGTAAAIDAITAGFPQIFNGTVPFIIVIPAAVSQPITGFHYIETQG
jgi:hypothetical protein